MENKYKINLGCMLFLLVLPFISASNFSVWQGQYYTGTTFNTGTYVFNFTVYDSLTNGNICFSNITSLTTGSWGQWKTEQSGVGNSCNNASQDYFLKINIDGTDQIPRRRLTVWDFLRKDINSISEGNLLVQGNITAEYFFGNGSQLTDVCLLDGTNCPSGVVDTDTQKGTSGDYLYNDSSLIYFNDTLLNNTIDSRAGGDNSSFNQTLTDILYAGIEWDYNQTTATYDLYNDVWSSTYNATYAASVGNSSWNQSLADTLYLAQTQESNLNVNSSDYWDDLNDFNATQIENNAGTLNIIQSWLITLFNSLFAGKTTDDLGQGSVNLYDNSSWNQSFADTLYSDTQKGTFGDYLYNDSLLIYFNETRLNITINNKIFASGIIDTIWNITGSTYLYNKTGILDVNETKLNNTILSKASVYNDTTRINLVNTTSNIKTLVNSVYLNLSGKNANQNINISPYNLTSSWFFGKLNASYIQNAPWAISTSKWNITGSTYLYNRTGILDVNETKLNNTILSKASVYNDTTRINLVNTTANIKSLVNGVYLNLSGKNANQNINISPYNFQSANLTLTKKITFGFGQVIDNLVSGWIKITGGLNVTGNAIVQNNLTVERIVLENDVGHNIYDNSTCVIIKGDTSTMYIC